MTARKAPVVPAGSLTTGAELRAFYEQCVDGTDFDLEIDDQVLVGQAAATLDLIRSLQRELDLNGPILTTASGATRTNPAAVEIRQQRTALAKLCVLVSHRIDAAVSGSAPAGVQPGSTRGSYGGTGAARRGRPLRRKSK